MSKPLKRMLADHLKDRYGGAASACVVDLTGMDVATTEKLRGVLRKSSARLEVVKNRIARKAFLDTPLRALGEAMRGPSALVTSDESIVEIAKKLLEFSREHKQLKLKQAILEGDSSLLTVEQLSRMKSRREIIGDVAACIWGPGRRVAGAIASPQGRIAGCIKALAEKGETGEPSVAAA